MSRSILHVDMDAFFASVEELDRPELAGRPVIVGGTPQGRGVVAAASYEVRKYGVHSAMPTATALRLCPHAVLIPPRHGRYAELSRRIRAVFERYSPQVEPLSVDEAFIDVTASERLFGSAATIGRRIKDDIREELGLVASVGLAPNKFLAKLASDLDKPDGFLAVAEEGVAAFLAPLPIGRLWGVGPKSAARLERLGITTVGRLREYPERMLADHVGRAAAEHLWQLARGIDERPVEPVREAKSVSHETTFHRDIADPGLIRGWLRELAEQVGSRLRHEGHAGRTVTLKVRFRDFSTTTPSRTLSAPTDVTTEIRDAALALYAERIGPGHPSVRLLGVGVSGFGPPDGDQLSLFDQDRQRAGRVDGVLDDIRARFGADGLRRGIGVREQD